MLNFSPYLIVAGLLILMLLAAAFVLVERLGGSGSLPYGPVSSLLTASEMRFYLTLRQVVGANALIMVKVRLADLVTIKATGKEWWRAFSPVGSKHIDFLLAAPQTLAPLLVIELDDSTHQRADRRERDAKVDTILATVGLPILHVPVRKVYDGAMLAGEIRAITARTPAS